MAIFGWGSGIWGAFKWGGEIVGDIVYTAETVPNELTLLCQITEPKRINRFESEVEFSLLPEFDISRAMRSEINLSLLPEYSDIGSGYSITVDDTSLILLPEYLIALLPFTEDNTFSLTPESLVAGNPVTDVEFSLTPEYEVSQEISISSLIQLSLTNEYSDISVDYSVDTVDNILEMIEESSVYGWRCAGRKTSSFSCQNRISGIWAEEERKTQTYTNISR